MKHNWLATRLNNLKPYYTGFDQIEYDATIELSLQKCDKSRPAAQEQFLWGEELYQANFEM